MSYSPDSSVGAKPKVPSRQPFPEQSTTILPKLPISSVPVSSNPAVMTPSQRRVPSNVTVAAAAAALNSMTLNGTHPHRSPSPTSTPGNQSPGSATPHSPIVSSSNSNHPGSGRSSPNLRPRELPSLSPRNSLHSRNASGSALLEFQQLTPQQQQQLLQTYHAQQHQQQQGHAPSFSPSPTVTSSISSSSTVISTLSHGPSVQWTAGSATGPLDDDLALFTDIDARILSSSVVREIHRIVRLCSAQPSFQWLLRTLETQVRAFAKAEGCRLFLVKRDGYRWNGAKFPLGVGLVGHAHRTKEVLNLVNPQADERYLESIDYYINEHNSPLGAVLCVPIEADTKLDCSGPRDVVAVLQIVRLASPSSAASSSSSSENPSDPSDPHAHHHHHSTSPTPKPFSPLLAKALARLAEFLGNMLRTSSRLDQAQAQYNASLTYHHRNAGLLDVAKALASETRLDAIVSIIVKQVPELLDCDRCTLFFVDKERQQLIVTKNSSQGRRKNLVSWIFGQSNAPELPFPEGSTEIRFPMDKGMAGHVAKSGEIINIEDAHLDKRFNPLMDMTTGYRTRSMLCVPMMDANGIIIGVVQAINKNPFYPRFDKEDETLLLTFSAQAALAVRNSQLFERTQTALRQSDALLEVTHALSMELKIGPLMKLVVAKVQNLLESERCTVFIVDKERKELYTSDSMSYGMGPALPIDTSKEIMIRFPMDRGIAGSVATTGVTVNIPDAYKDDRFNKAMDKKTGYVTKAILCMAIKNHRSEIVGVLQVMNKTHGRCFDESDEKLLAAFSAQAAVAIENSRLFQQTEKALNHALADQRNLKFMLSVTKNLFSDMHMSSMIDQMTMQVHHLLKADDCALYLVDARSKEFYLARESPSPQRRWPFGTGIVGLVAQSGHIIRISSQAHLDPRFHPDVDQRPDKTTHSILCCPIMADAPDGQYIIGVISVRDEKDRGGFENEEEKLLKVFCAQAAVAILNARRFNDIMDKSELKERDRSAADYLKDQRGMNLGEADIDAFSFRMEDIQLKSSIGTGSYGEVFRAIVHGKVVAVKKLHVRNLKAEQVDAFCKEASLMCQLKHPNVVGFIGAVTEPSNLCIITQYCHRGSLADLLLEDSIPMDFSRKLQFAKDAARGMLYLHSSNPVILHRDLKSDNLLVGDDWTVKVADFGLTRFMSEKKAMTQVGTPMWMAPEIIMGRKYTEKADVYAFGIILWEILTRLEPYENKEPMQIVVEVVNEDLRPDIPPEFRHSPLVPLMRDCWATDPNQRPPFRVIVERLEAIDPSPQAQPLPAASELRDIT